MNEEQRKKVMETATIEEVVISGKDISFVKENGFIPNAVETISKKTNKKHIFDLLSFWYDYEKGRMSKTDFAEKMFVYSEVNNCTISETKKKWLLEWAETESEQPQQENEFPERVRKGLNDNVLLEMFGNNKETLIEFLLFCEQAKNGESIIKEANRLKLFDNNTIKKVHDKIFDLFGNKVTGYDNWKTYAVRKR